MSKGSVIVALFVGACLMAQVNEDESQRLPADGKHQFTVHGCLRRPSVGDYFLVHSDVGKIYELDSTREIEFDDYMGQRVEVIGTESPGLSSSKRSSFRVARPLTIMVDSIRTVSKRCKH
jgi:hypothetical protein